MILGCIRSAKPTGYTPNPDFVKALLPPIAEHACGKQSPGHEGDCFGLERASSPHNDSFIVIEDRREL